MATVYYDKDADPRALRGKTIAVLGYGSQGHAHAQNLRDSGHQVVVGARQGVSWTRAEHDGFTVREASDAARNADVIALLVPDQHHRSVYERSVKPHLRQGTTLLVAHAFSVHFKEIEPAADIDVVMIAPKAPGHRMRAVFKEGK